jgi:hypothetical protein
MFELVSLNRVDLFFRAINENANRIEKGLKITYEDGSFIKLSEEYFLDSIELVKLQNRALLKLENPYIRGLDLGYKKYNYLLPEKVTTVSLLH